MTSQSFILVAQAVYQKKKKKKRGDRLAVISLYQNIYSFFNEDDDDRDRLARSCHKKERRVKPGKHSAYLNVRTLIHLFRLNRYERN